MRMQQHSPRRRALVRVCVVFAFAALLGSGAAGFANRLQGSSERQWKAVGDVNELARDLETLQGLRATGVSTNPSNRIAVLYAGDGVGDQIDATFARLDRSGLLPSQVASIRLLVDTYRKQVAADVNTADAAMLQKTVFDPKYVPIREALAKLQIKMTDAAQRSGRKTNALSWTVFPLLSLACGAMVLRNARHRRLVIKRETERSEAAKFEAIVGSSHDVITLLDEHANFVYVSPASNRIFGYSPTQLVAEGAPALLSASALSQLKTANAFVRETRTSNLLEVKLRDGTGVERHFELTGTDAQEIDGLSGTLWTWHDIHDRKLLEIELKHQAFHDPLTSLANRALFQSRLEHALVSSARTGASTCVMFIDLDQFKTVNDSLGHSVGDEVLKHVAQSVGSALRPGDTLARLGGDEFALLLEATETREAEAVAEQLLIEIQRSCVIATDLGSVDVSLSASIGVATTKHASTEASELLRNADMAMYAAKRNGKNCVRVYSNQLHGNAKDQFRVQSELRHALENNELELYLQPLVDLNKASVSGFEALIRWNHPERGLLNPIAFIDIAEESGLIVEIGRWVVTRAAQQCAQINVQTGRHFKVNANVSPKQLKDQKLVSTVSQALKDNALDPFLLVLEITETALIDESGSAAAMLDRLKALGVRLALDDFGTGFSTLSSLRSFPIDIVKIDKSFVENSLGDDDRTQLLTEAIVQLGRQLGLSTVAEGIETVQQLERMRGLGCETGQGYLFSRPVPFGDIPAAITRIEQELALTKAATVNA